MEYYIWNLQLHGNKTLSSFSILRELINVRDGNTHIWQKSHQGFVLAVSKIELIKLKTASQEIKREKAKIL